jgi:putative transferase (TIGR04331 family)
MRGKFIISSESYSGFENFVRVLLPEMIPTCYLEGFTQLNQQAESLPWPSKPKFIFTSNNFDTDEIFKAWAGLKTEEGVPYFVGQHGNNYGTLQGSKNWVEHLSVDNFFTWGWFNDNIKNIPAFVLKTYNTRMKTKPGGGLLLLLAKVPAMTSLDDVFYEFGINQEQQFRFVEALPKEIQKELTVRLHDSWVKTRWSDDERWNDYKASLPLDPGVDPLKKIIEKNRLVVHSYDTTGILEGLASNIPTLCFWNGGLDHLLPSAKPYYELLRGAGILADTPEHAALLVAQYWDNIYGWWKSEQVQSARRLFCKQYARVEKSPVLSMKRLLTVAALNQNNQTEPRSLELR